jgi:Na+-translocating ferredoxin:NAD+ oxidoreductase RnfD subunit
VIDTFSAQSPLFPHAFKPLTTQRLYFGMGIAIGFPLIVSGLRGGPPVFWIFFIVATGVLVGELALYFAGGGISFPERSIVSGLAVAALMPLSASYLTVWVASVVATLAGSTVAGSRRQIWVHPAILGVVVAGVVTTPGAVGHMSVVPLVDASIQIVTPVISQVFFEPLGVRVPGDAWHLLLGSVHVEGGTLTAGLLMPVLVGAVVVYGEDLVLPVLPLTLLGSFVLVGLLRNANVVEMVALSEFPLVATILVAEPTARPASRRGMVLFGILAGALMALLWTLPGVPGPILIGYFFASLYIPLIDHVIVTISGKKR